MAGCGWCDGAPSHRIKGRPFRYTRNRPVVLRACKVLLRERLVSQVRCGTMHRTNGQSIHAIVCESLRAETYTLGHASSCLSKFELCVGPYRRWSQASNAGWTRSNAAAAGHHDAAARRCVRQDPSRKISTLGSHAHALPQITQGTCLHYQQADNRGRPFDQVRPGS